jgi:hypothetical protein
MADLHLQFSFQNALLSSVFAWVFWIFLKHFVIKHPLDNIPGPSSPSFLTGGYLVPFASLSTSLRANHLRAGNVGQMTDPLGWSFHKHLIDVFGGVAKYHGLFGVCSAGIKVYARIDFITIA